MANPIVREAFKRLIASLAMLAALAPVAAHAAQLQKENTCVTCHAPSPSEIWGRLRNVSERFRTIQVAVGQDVQIIKFGDSTKVIEGERTGGPRALMEIPEGREIRVTLGKEAEACGDGLAAIVTVKQPYVLSEDMAMDIAELTSLLLTRHQYTIADARTLASYGEGHIDGAKAIPYEFFSRFAKMVLPADKASLVIFYGESATSREALLEASEAVKRGYTNVRVLKGGLEAWKDSMGVIVMEPTTLKKLIETQYLMVLVDLRGPLMAQTGYIRGAVAIRYTELSSYRAMFPGDMDALIVLYDEKQPANGAFNRVRGWGYRNTALLKDGMRGWRAMVDARSYQGLVGEIVMYSGLYAGEIGASEFRKILEDRPKDKAILDVREGSNPGVIKGALAIPLSELPARLKELPEGKEIIVYSTKGDLAGKAFEFIVRSGRKARYLDAVVQVAPDGYVEVTPR